MHEQVIIGEQTAGRAASVRRSLMTMVSNLSANTFDLAALLYEARENNYASAWGFSSLAEYAEQELGLKKRKSEYLTRIVKVASAVGLRREQYEPCGVSKLREITRLNPEGSYWNPDTHANEDLAEHIVRLILDHDKLNVQQTKDEVARLMGMTGPNRRVMRSFSTDQSTWDNVMKPALEKARRTLGSQGRDDEGFAKEYPDGVCWEVIAAAFNADPNYDEDLGDTELPIEENPAVVGLPMEEQQ